MKIIGHRGSPWEAPENTLESFALARSAGAHGVELDVRLCSTGEVVCCHDVTLDRIARIPCRVRTTGWNTLRHYDVGRGIRLTTLEPVLDLWRHHGLVNVEIKSDDVDLPALVAAVAKTLDRVSVGDVLVSSFEPDALAMLQAVRPTTRLGQLVSDMSKIKNSEYPRNGALVNAIHPWYADATPERIAAWRSQGLEVHVYTVDDAIVARSLRAAGATSVITNVPSAMNQAMGEV
jgi:glycerophosphoryl diester phosphodiesterase